MTLHVANLYETTAAAAPSPAVSGVSLGLASVVGAPATPFQVTLSPEGVTPTRANSEIVEVTNLAGTTATIVRDVGGWGAKSVAAGWVVRHGVTIDLLNGYATKAARNDITATLALGQLSALGTPTIATGAGAHSLAISADGVNVYVTDNESKTLHQYSRNAATGLLTALGTPTIATGNGPLDIAISPDGRHVYVTNYESNTVSQYEREASGQLKALGTPTIATGTAPRNICISPDGLNVYVTNEEAGTVQQYSRAPATGLLTVLGTPTVAVGSKPRGITISPGGGHVYVANWTSGSVSQLARSASTGLLTALSPATIAAGANADIVRLSPDGKHLYCTNFDTTEATKTISQYARNTDGTLLALGTVVTGNGPTELAVSADGACVYVCAWKEGKVWQYKREPSGLLVAMNTNAVAAGSEPDAVVLSPDQKHVYVANYNKGLAATINQYARALSQTIAFPAVTANSRVFPVAQDDKTVGTLRLSSRVAGASVTISSTVSSDNGVIAIEAFEPSPS